MNIEVILKRVIDEGDTVLDVGGHVGNVAWFMSRCVGPRGKVYSFEPNPESFRALSAKAEKYTNLTALNCAISNSMAPVTLHFGVTEKSSQASTICPDLVTTERLGSKIMSVEVPAITLDEYCTEYSLHPSVIKIDAEGAEPLVLDGAHSVLKGLPTLILEMGATKAIPNYATQLQALGYDLYFLDLHRFTSDPASWDHTVNTETPILRDCIILFADAETLAPFLANVLAIAPRNKHRLAGLRILSLAEALPLLADPKRSISMIAKSVVRRVLIPRSVEERFPEFIGILRNLARRV